jgi:hypothetical protein
MSTNLPIAWEDKVNSPELLAFLQQYGPETYLTAEEINQIRDAINEIGLPDDFIKTTPLTRVDNQVSIGALDFKWILNKNIFENVNPYSTNISAAPDGYHRKDIIVANTSGGFNKYEGDDDAEVAIQPNTPDNTLLVSVIDIYGATIGDPSSPILGDAYIKKIERQKVIVPNDVLSFTLNDERHFVEFIHEEQGDFRYFILGANYVSGQNHPLRIRNNSGHAFTLMHLVSSGSSLPGETVLFFPNEDNFILGDKEIIEFVYDTDSNRFEFFGVISNNIQHFKGVYTTLSALNSAHPTASAGDYAQVNEVGATDVVNYNWDSEESIWVAGGSGGGAVNTDSLPEGSSNFYFTGARVLATLLTGISFVTGGAVVSTDTILQAFGKFQKQINDLITVVSGKGDMDTTTPQDVSGLKTFLAGKFGLRNGANNFTSFFTNTNTASRTYTLQNRDGTLADLLDISGVASSINEQTNFQTGFAYTIGLIDVNTKLSFNSPAGNTQLVITVPNDATTNFQIGSKVRVVRTFGGGKTGVYGMSGVVFTGQGTFFENGLTMLLTKVGVNTWNTEFNSPFTANGNKLFSIYEINSLLRGRYIHNANPVLCEESGNTKMSMNGANGSGFYSFNHVVKYDSDLSTSYDDRSFIDKGYFDSKRFDMSSLGLYANDAAAATGGVPVGYAYINSSTGATQRRLT